MGNLGRYLLIRVLGAWRWDSRKTIKTSKVSLNLTAVNI